MAQLQIPDRLKEGFRLLLSIQPDKLASLIDSIKKTGSHNGREFFVGAIKDSLDVPRREADHMLRVFISLYGLQSTFEEEEFLDDLITAISESEWSNEIDYDKEYLKRNLSNILLLEDSIGLIAKVSELLTEYDKRFVNARIVTDLRPTFRKSLNINDELEDVLVVHQLRIIYHGDDGKHHEVYVALDRKDLESMKEIAERAILKEDIIANSLSKTKIAKIPTRGIHN